MKFLENSKFYKMMSSLFIGLKIITTIFAPLFPTTCIYSIVYILLKGAFDTNSESERIMIKSVFWVLAVLWIIGYFLFLFDRKGRRYITGLFIALNIQDCLLYFFTIFSLEITDILDALDYLIIRFIGICSSGFIVFLLFLYLFCDKKNAVK